jgi:two-component system sensor histidine kinase DesK
MDSIRMSASPMPSPRSKPLERGWVRYAWLAYLFMLVWQPLFDPDYSRAALMVTLASVAAFLPLYLRGYTARGGALIGYSLAIAVLGLLTTPFNLGALIYFVYASAAVGDLEPVPLARHLIGLFTLMAVGAAFTSGAAWPQPLLYFLPTIFFVLFIGMLTSFDAERRRNLERLESAHEENQRLATIAERERIARDLHDLLGHTLSLVTLKAELAARLAVRDPARAAQEMREVERISREATGQVREAVQGYKSRGLPGELAGAKLALEAASIRLEYYTEPVNLSPAQESVLSLALREAVTNVIRHSAASRCAIRLVQDETGAYLEVEDDGRGGAALAGSGLTGMRQRVEALGGGLETTGEQGFRLKVFLPNSIPGPPSLLEPGPQTN